MKENYTLEEAWKYLETYYPHMNVYDTYVGKKDFMLAIDNANRRYQIQKELAMVEISFGITKKEEQIRLLEEKLDALELPTLGWKYDIPEEVEKEVKEEYRKTQKQIMELKEKVLKSLETIYIQGDILHSKKLT